MLGYKKIIRIMVILIVTIFLAACGSKPTIDPNQKMTEIAATVRAQLTLSAPVIPTTTTTSEAPTATKTITPAPPTNTPAGGFPTATLIVIPTQPGNSSTDDAKFISDVTIPDGATLKAGEQFTKTWRFQNTGKTTWTKDYAIFYLDGNLQGRNGNLMFKIAKDVAPGEFADISALFTAPSTPGTFSSYWKMYNTMGYVFGDMVSVRIMVGNPTATPVPPTATFTKTATKKPTKTPTATPETPTAVPSTETITP